MKNLALYGGLALFMAGAWASNAVAQATPVFELRAFGLLDSDFNVKLCPSCVFNVGAKVLPLGEAMPGDTLVVKAFASGWDDDPSIGICTTGGECRRDFVCTDTRTPCTEDADCDPPASCERDTRSCATKHCTDTGTLCTVGDCNVGASCVLDTCNPDPAVGAFQWTLNTNSFGNGGPGRITLANQTCDAGACFDCQESPLDEGGPGGACGACSCFHNILFACFGNCTCCSSPLGEACPAATGICAEEAAGFIDTSDPRWILGSSAQTVAVFQTSFEWIGTLRGIVGTPEGEFPSYMGTVFLTLPSCGGGQFIINFNTDSQKSFLNDSNAVRLPLPVFEPLIVNLSPVADPCDSTDCDDNKACTVDTCNNETCGAVCEHADVVCSTAGFVCNPSTGECEDVQGACCRDDGATCDLLELSPCESLGGTFQGVGTICDELLAICEPGGTPCTTLVADFPPNCAIDARQPSTIDGLTLQGWDMIDVLVGPTGCELTAGQLVVDVVPSAAQLGISLVTQDGDLATIEFDAIIPTQNWTCVSLADFPGQQVCVGNLPGDVDGDGFSNPALDIGAIIDCLNNLGTCAAWVEDADRDGATGVLDLTRVIDLFNGAGAFASWTGASLGGNACPSAP